MTKLLNSLSSNVVKGIITLVHLTTLNQQLVQSCAGFIQNVSSQVETMRMFI